MIDHESSERAASSYSEKILIGNIVDAHHQLSRFRKIRVEQNTIGFEGSHLKVNIDRSSTWLPIDLQIGSECFKRVRMHIQRIILEDSRISFCRI